MYDELYSTSWATEAQRKAHVASQCCHLEAGPEGGNPGTPIPGPDLGPLSFSADSPSSQQTLQDTSITREGMGKDTAKGKGPAQGLASLAGLVGGRTWVQCL